MIDVFHHRCHKKILGISWHDLITNDEVMTRSGQTALHDIVATRRCFIGHILRLPSMRLASLAIEWRSKDGKRNIGRPKKIWWWWAYTGAIRQQLPAIMPTGDESSTNVLHGTGETKSK